MKSKSICYRRIIRDLKKYQVNLKNLWEKCKTYFGSFNDKTELINNFQKYEPFLEKNLKGGSNWIDLENKSFGNWMMHFIDDLLETSLRNTPFRALELCYLGSSLEFSEKNKRLLQTYFGRKQKDLFWFVWSEHLGLEQIKESSQSRN
jgi:hypothetical protein